MAGENDVVVGITADDSGLAQAFEHAQGVVTASSEEMAAAVDAMSAATASGFTEAAAAAAAMGETAEQQTARIRAMVQASLAQAEANSGLALSERAVREAMGERTVATEAQIAATQASIAAQNAQMGSLAEFMAAERAAAAAQEEAAAAAVGSSAAIAEVGGAASAATKELGVMAGEAMRGNFARLEQSSVTLANRMGLLSAIFTPMGLAIAAAGATLFLLGEQAYKADQKLVGFNNAVELTNGASAHTAQQLQQLTSTVADIGFKSEDAAKAVTSLAVSGKFVGDTLDQAAKGAADFAELTGQKIETVVSEFEKLGADPVKALIELDAKTHGVDSSIVALVASAQAQGNTFAATTIATDALAESLGKSAEKAKEFQKENSFWANLERGIASSAEAEAGVADTLAVVKVRTDAAREAQEKLNQARNIVSNVAQDSVNHIIEALTKEKDRLDRVTETYGKGKAGLAEYTIAKAEAALKSIALTAAEQTFYEELRNGVSIFQAGKDAYNAYSTAIAHSRDVLTGLEDGLRRSAEAADAAVYSHKHANDGMKEFAATELQLAEQLDALSTNLEGPYAAAWAKYSENFDKVDNFLEKARQQYQAGRISLEEYNADVAIGRDLQAQYALKFAETTQKLDDQANIVEQLTTKLDQNTRLLQAQGVAHEELKAVIDAENEARKQYEQHLRDSATLSDAERAAIVATVEAHHQMDEAIKNSQAVAKDWAGVLSGDLTQAFDTFDKDLIEGGSLMKDLDNLWKQVVVSIINEAMKLAVINPILKSIFGDAGGNLPTQSFGSMFNNVSNFFGGGQGGGGNFLNSWFNPSTAGGAIMTPAVGSGVFAGYGSSDAFAGSAASVEGSLDYGGGAGGFTDFGGSAGAGGSAGFSMGNVFAIGGGILAGYNEFQNAGGGIGGTLGAAAYGYGTYVAGTALAAGMSAGLAAGLAAIPVVGWIALGAMVLDKITGGGLFGTDANKAVGGNMSEEISSSGARIWGEETYKGKKPLFGGSYYEEHNIPVDQQTKDNANAFVDALKAGVQQFADVFKEDVPDLVGGTFHETLDKTGKVTGTDDTVLGVNRKGETEAQFQERLQADNFLAVLDKMGLGASEFVASLQGDADKLWAAVQDFGGVAEAVQLNLDSGFKMMALGSDQDLKSVMAFVEGAQKAGETLTQTYNRLLQAQASYDQFVGQFVAAPSYVDPFEASMAQLYAQMTANIDQANALAQAAGATGANITDLTNIQKHYAAEMAQLTQQLQANAQALAFSLGLTEIGTLDQVNAEIQQLQSQASTATTSVSGLGVAFERVSQQADAALQLMLGNLSPLNDQQKLQYALQGLREGTVTADQVLQIGQRLYASSEAYNQLFQTVLPYAGAGSGSTTGYYYTGGNVVANTGQQQSGLSEADQKKLADLLKEQATLQAAQLLSQYQTLANQIAEIAMAKGEDWRDVVKAMGINLDDFAKGLGLTTDQLDAYFTSLEKQTDSNKDNTTSIVNAINALPVAIALAIQGKDPTAAHTAEPGSTISGDGKITSYRPIAVTNGGSAQPGADKAATSSGAPAARQISDGDAEAIGKAMAKALGVDQGLGKDVGSALILAVGQILNSASSNNPRSGRVAVNR